MKILPMPGMDQDEFDIPDYDCYCYDWKVGGEAFLVAFDKQLRPFGLEVVCWDGGQDTYVWKIQRRLGE